jgi:acyl-CoA synthetase (NDP forming)
MENRTRLFGQRELSRLIDPKSIAVIGASETPGSFGSRTIENLSSYRGRLFPINPKRDRIHGIPAFPSLEALPEKPDSVIISVPREQVVDLAARCADMGVGGAIIYSSGFAELGLEDRIIAQRRLAEIADKSGMRIIGPNCVGIINFTSRIGMHFMPKFNEMPIVEGRIGLVSQSGGLGYTVIQSLERGVGFSQFLSAGNSCDVDICDLINYLVEDPSTSVIACMFEGARDGGRLVEAGRRALAAGKPLIFYKMGNTDVSRRAALSHTGTLSGASVAYAAAFQEVGAVVVDNWEEVLETACLFDRAGIPKSRGVGVMSSSGGAGVISADKAEEFGVDLPAPGQQTIDELKKLVPDFGSVSNPTDMTAETLKSFDLYGSCIRAFADDPIYGVVVVPMLSAQKPTTIERAKYLDGLASGLSKPMCLVWINEWLQGPGSEVYDGSAHISMFRSMGRCMKAIRSWLDYFDWRAAILETRFTRITPAESAQRARSALSKIGGRACLSEAEAKGVLGCYGIACNKEALATSAAHAVQLASDIGFPVVLKVDSPDIPHKTEAGVVKLKLGDAGAVLRAYEEIEGALRKLPAGTIANGIVVQEMVQAEAEMMIGAVVDPQFGPLITCGFGGVAVEITKDIQTRRAPVNYEQAMAMVMSLRRRALLFGYRNLAPLEVDGFVNMVCRVSELISDLADEIAEIDVNPVLLGTHRAAAVDALVIARKHEVKP